MFNEILILSILFAVLFRQFTLAIILAGILWFFLGFIVEKNFWIYFALDHIQDRIASIFLAYFIMADFYFLINHECGNLCVLLPLLGQTLLDFNKFRKTESTSNLLKLFLNVLIIIVVFIILDGKL